ncbi:MAG: Crp/Fnr family transcriptional regulator [Puia sp.]|nr:Crp/Fnr family transcriptional regulator [Puia sp.]
MPALTELFDHMSRFVPVSAEDKQVLTDLVEVRSVRKKEHLLSPGEICHANYFVKKGCLRMYFIKDNGLEHTLQFALENWWITDFMSLENRKPTNMYLQAVEPAEVVVLTKTNMDILSGQVPQMERYLRLIAERAFAASLFRMQYFFELSVESRYEQFNRRFPEFVQRIPQYMLAGFLGFTPEVLSKIRSKKRAGARKKLG